jgi:hypothetical protein
VSEFIPAKNVSLEAVKERLEKLFRIDPARSLDRKVDSLGDKKRFLVLVALAENEKRFLVNERGERFGFR